MQGTSAYRVVMACAVGKAIALLLVGLVVPAAGEGTIFSILLKPSDDATDPSPQEYFDEMQMYFAEGGGAGAFGPDSGFTFLSQVDRSQDLADGLETLQECDLDPFWEKGKIVTDLKYCPYSMVKLLVYSLVPTVAMFFGMIGLWSRQRNVQGRGKDTQIGALVGLGLALLSVGYDWFFSWELFRSPQGAYQAKISEFGLAHLVACVALNFLMVHFWFRRKFLVGMPWYEYHKHGFGLHIVTAIMYVQPQSVVLLSARLFNHDLFNVHFGTPSKMNEVLSNVGCLSLLVDVPQFALQMSVWMADKQGTQAPKVTRVSMGLIVICIAMVLKRQYIASVERQWYKEIVKMAGVRRLTTYGGASRWLKFQKRTSATAAAAKGGSTSQQQLFLAWMQSMGRRQESIFANEDDGQRKALTGGDSESEDSEDDLDSLSESEGSEENEDNTNNKKSNKADGSESGSEEGSGSQGSGDLEGSESEGSEDFEDEEEESEVGSDEDNEVELQAYGRRRGRRRRRPADEEAPLRGRRRTDGSSVVSSSVGGLLGFARDIADDVSQTSGAATSESDIFAFAKNIAGHMNSDSGVVTESSQGFGLTGQRGRRSRRKKRRDDAFADADVFSDTGGSVVAPDDPILEFARNVADDVSGAGGSTEGGSDIFGFAREVAGAASDSGIGGTVVSGEGSDIWAFARQAARQVSETGAPSSAGASQSDIFAFAREVAGHAAEGDGSTVDGSDIFAFARRAADNASRSGVGTDASGSDIFAFARAAADRVSRSGVGSDTGSRASRRRGRSTSDDGASGSDIFAFARNAADDISQSGVGTGTSAGVSDIFAAAQQAADGFSRSGVGSATSAVSGGISDIFQYAQGVADDASHSGVGSSAHPGRGRRRPKESAAKSAVSEDGSDIFAAARRAAEDMSGVGSTAQSGVESDIFATARRAAAEASNSGVGAQSAAGFSDIFARPGASARGTLPRGRQEDNRSQVSANSQQSGVESDIFVAAQRAADAFSHSGVASASQAGQSRVGLPQIFAQVGGGQAGGRGDQAGGSRGRTVPAKDVQSEQSDGSESDIFAAARQAAGDASVSGVASAAPTRSVVGGMSDIFAPAGASRGGAARAIDVNDVDIQEAGSRHSDSESDIFEAARAAAGDASVSGVASAAAGRSTIAGMSDIFAVPGRPPPPLATAARAGRGNTMGQLPKAPAALPAQSASRPVARAAGSQSRPEEASADGSGEFDLFALARGAADQTSRSGVQSASMAGSRAGNAMADLFSSNTRPRAQQSADDEVSQTGSDIWGIARDAAADFSQSGVDSGSDIFGAALGAAGEFSQSGVGSRSGVGSQSDGGVSDIFASARRAAGAASDAGSFASRASGVGGGQDLFAVSRRGAAQAAPPVQRRFMADSRHSSAPPSLPSDATLAVSSAPPLKLDQIKMACPPEDPHVDQPPWAVVSLPRLLSPPPPPRKVPPSPPGAPPLDADLPPAGTLPSGSSHVSAMPRRAIVSADAPAQRPEATGRPMLSSLPARAVPKRHAELSGSQLIARPEPRVMEEESAPGTVASELPRPEAVQEAASSPAGAGQMLRFAREVAAAAAAPSLASGSASAASSIQASPEVHSGAPAGAPDLEGLFLRRPRGSVAPPVPPLASASRTPAPPDAIPAASASRTPAPPNAMPVASPAAPPAPSPAAPKPPPDQPPSPRSLRRLCEAQRRGNAVRPERLPPPSPPGGPSAAAAARAESLVASPKSAWTRRLRKAEEEGAQHFMLDTEERRKEDRAQHFMLDTEERRKENAQSVATRDDEVAAASASLPADPLAATAMPAAAVGASTPAQTNAPCDAAASGPSAPKAAPSAAAQMQAKLALRRGLIESSGASQHAAGPVEGHEKAMAEQPASDPPTAQSQDMNPNPRQSRLQLRQERLRQGIASDDRGYKRKHARKPALDVQQPNAAADMAEDAPDQSSAPGSNAEQLPGVASREQANM